MISGCLALIAMLLAGCESPPPSPPPPDRAELTSAVDRFLNQSLAPGIRNVRAILVAVDDELMVERYYQSSPEEHAAVASVTKSVVSTLIGIAVTEGFLDLEQTLVDLLPSYADSMSPDVRAITLRQLLTMSAGLPGDEDPNWAPTGGDWVSNILGRGRSQSPGDGFVYSSVSSHLLAAILAETTGKPVLAYARAKLFGPLGIETRPAFQPALIPGRPDPIRAYERAAFAWPRDPQGIHIGFGSLKLTAPDMLKLGTLFLHEGEWQGDQLVPAAWVREAVSPAVPTGGQGPGGHYGFQWWVTSAGEHRAFAAIGFGGQIIEVVPDLDLVVVASTWIDEDLRFDASTWELMVTHALVPEFEPD